MPSLKETQAALGKAARVEEILRGENPSPEKAEVARKLAEEHFVHLADLEPRPDYLEDLDED